jgi:hypothetical protein
MASLEIKGLDKLLRGLEKLPGNARFALSKALNATARDVQQHTVNKLLPEKFTLRSRGAPWQRPGNKLGFNISFAKKDKLESRIGSEADWLKLQEEGGTKRPRTGKNVAIPHKGRPTPTSVIPKNKKPRYLLRGFSRNGEVNLSGTVRKAGDDAFRTNNRKFAKDARGFLIKMKSGDSGIFTRYGPKKGEIQLEYWLDSAATIKAALSYEKTGQEIALATFQPNYAAAIQTVAFDIISR